MRIPGVTVGISCDLVFLRTSGVITTFNYHRLILLNNHMSAQAETFYARDTSFGFARRNLFAIPDL